MSDATVVRMPKLADTLVEGTLGQWLKEVGDEVRTGEPLASIETDKVTTDLTSPASGTLLELLINPGDTVPIETPIARIGSATAVPAHAPSSAPPAPDVQPAAPAPRRPATTRVTPVASRLLAEHHVSADDVPSRAHRITKRDVLAFVAQHQPAPAGVQPLSPMRRAIAAHMAGARQTIPHGETVMAADLTLVVAWRERHKDANVTFTAFFVHALARTMEPPAHLGVAVALDEGLIVPVIRNAQALSLEATGHAIADLADRARSGRLAPDATQGATMTVTNVGSFGNLLASPIVPLGQVAILAPGIVERRALPTGDGGIRIGWQCLLSLVFDRRALDDLAADRFLGQIVAELVAIPDRVEPLA